ncbi:MAG: ribonuclease P protein component [Phycisphaerae bacterium]|nr:ribonuclease P protein component [Phycisphaerae bacterium]
MAAGLDKWRKHRLSGRKAFARVFSARHSAANRSVVVYALCNDVGRTRMGISIGRKCGGAVVRNRIKRWFREAFRARYDELPRGVDLIVIPRPGAIQKLEDCVRSLLSVADRAVQRQARSAGGLKAEPLD